MYGSCVPDPFPEDPYVFGPPGSASGFDSHKYGSRSGSFLFLIQVLSGQNTFTILKLNFIY
jgi:hypothetical protein